MKPLRNAMQEAIDRVLEKQRKAKEAQEKNKQNNR